MRAAITEGALFRAVAKGGTIGKEAMTAQALYDVVADYAAQLEQIQLSFGHASLTTTERYLGARMDFNDAPCDRLGLNPRTGVA